MSKWKCEICGVEFENFHAQGFDNKIYCPLCYFKRENQELKKQLEEKENQQKVFVEYLEGYIAALENQKESVEGLDIAEEHILMTLEENLAKYKEIIGG